ncbi:zinc finger, CCHC-type containing protein [Tanacetum coccineum]
MECLPKRRWSKRDNSRSRIMIKEIDKRLYKRRIMRNLEKFLGGREYEEDFKLLEQTVFPMVTAAGQGRSLETASPVLHDVVTTHLVTASQHFMMASARTDSHTDLEDSTHDGSIFSSCYLFRNPFSSTTMGDKNPIRTLEDYSKPNHEGYKNTIKPPVGNNVVPLRSDTIRLVQNRCSFHGLRFEDSNKHLKDFLKVVDLLDLDGANKERTRLRLFQFSLHDQASNWLERLPAGSITTWEGLTTRFLVQFFLPGRIAKLRNDILMFQQHHRESLSEAWTHFKDLLQKFPHHDIDLWL